MRRALVICSALALLLGCGGGVASPAPGNRPEPSSSTLPGGSTISNAPPGDAFMQFGGTPLPDGGKTPVAFGGGAPFDAAPSCDTPDASRPATASEGAAYCVCTSMPFGPPNWKCYGPAQDTDAGKPSPTCESLNSQPGTGSGSCRVTWGSCTDGGIYEIACVDSDCVCLVNGSTTAILEPRESCPQSKSDINALCGWNLQ
jgi:hypothetical protein